MILIEVLTAATAVVAGPLEGGASDCHRGAFRLDDGRVMALGPSIENTLRLRLDDGTTGRLYPQPGGAFAAGPERDAPPPPETILEGECGSDILRITMSDSAQSAKKLPLLITDTQFRSGSLTLRGRLVVSPGIEALPLVVNVHGSEDTSAVDKDLDQFISPANGVTSFVYDKRGTGKSEGRYTQDFEILASDAVNALAEAKRLLGARTGRAGFAGFSQGGWVAPLAATKTDADFIVVGYGLAIAPREEDAAQVAYDLERAGYGPDVLAKARELTAATSEVMASRFTRGFDQLDVVKAKYRGEPWTAKAQGEYTGIMLRSSTPEIREIGARHDWGTPWDYDPMAALRSFAKPMLWVLAGADSDAPSSSTEAILTDLQRDRPMLDVAVYPNTTHGLRKFAEDDAGNRTLLNYAPSYQHLILNWVKTGHLTQSPDVELRHGTAAGHTVVSALD